MKTETIAICITVLLFTGIITYGIVINEIYETPYEQCLKTCRYSDKLRCVEVCTQEFGEIINQLSEDIIPLVQDLIKSQSCEK